VIDCGQGGFREEECSGGDIGDDEKGVAFCGSMTDFDLWR